MPFNVSNFKANLVNEGARPTLFDVEIPSVYLLGKNVNFRCKAAQLPASTLGIIEVPYFGRKIKVPGDRTFAEWTITVINDESFAIRSSLESWSNQINQLIGNQRADPNYKNQNATVTQYAKDGSMLKQYSMVNIWPSEVGAIDLSWETTDSIEEYTVTLQYDYWTVVNDGIASATAMSPAE
jgi:T4-like virus tail tube protein gp19